MYYFSFTNVEFDESCKAEKRLNRPITFFYIWYLEKYFEPRVEVFISDAISVGNI